jgi:DMSO/TMAO reductase YedYZ molybdopterin-dependent catalytic subunit
VHRSHSNRARSASAIRGSAALIVAALAFCFSSSANGQTPQSANTALRITGKVERTLVMREADLEALPRKRLTVTDDKGARVTYEGVPVAEILQRAGIPSGEQIKGTVLKLYVIVEGSDGYQVVFALPEFDPDFTDRVVILADRRNGQAMPSPIGPFRVIVEGEKRHARWVREVTTLDVEEAQ